MVDLAKREILAYQDLMEEMEQRALLATLGKMVLMEDQVYQVSMERRDEKAPQDYLA